jgi:endonuclease YncB( thermonuclease family)
MRFNCRLKSIDSEEIKQKKSESDREVKTELAIKARNRLIQLVSNCKIDIQDKKNKKEISELLKTNTFIVEVRCGSFDKYGRLLVDLYSNSLLINDIMVLEGYAKSYDGKTKN